MSAASAVSVPTLHRLQSGGNLYQAGTFASVMRYYTPVARFPTGRVHLHGDDTATSVMTVKSQRFPAWGNSPAEPSLYTPRQSTACEQKCCFVSNSEKWIYAYTGSGGVVSAAHDWKSLPLLGSAQHGLWRYPHQGIAFSLLTPAVSFSAASRVAVTATQYVAFLADGHAADVQQRATATARRVSVGDRSCVPAAVVSSWHCTIAGFVYTAKLGAYRTHAVNDEYHRLFSCTRIHMAEHQWRVVSCVQSDGAAVAADRFQIIMAWVANCIIGFISMLMLPWP